MRDAEANWKHRRKKISHWRTLRRIVLTRTRKFDSLTIFAFNAELTRSNMKIFSKSAAGQRCLPLIGIIFLLTNLLILLPDSIFAAHGVDRVREKDDPAAARSGCKFIAKS